jgi:PAS domain S-box-containing protein
MAESPGLPPMRGYRARIRSTPARRYGFALLCTAAGAIVASAFHPILPQSPLTPLYAAVAVSAWYGGLRPGMLTAVLCGTFGAWFFLEPQHTLRLKFPESIGSLLAFLVVAVVISSLSEQSRRAIAGSQLAQQRITLLSEASEVLVSSLDYETTLAQVLRLSVPQLADWCSVNVLEPDGSITRLAAVHRDPEGAALLDEMQRSYPIDPGSEHPLAVAIRTGAAGLYPETQRMIESRIATSTEHLRRLRQLGTTSAIVVPMQARGRMFGAITFARTSIRQRYDHDDLELAELLARRAALAIDNARLFRQAQASETRFRNLFDGSEEAILVTGPTGATVDVNPAAEQLTGYSRAELLALPAIRLFEQPPGWGEQVLAAVRDHGTWHGESELRRSDGATVPVEARAARVELPDGAVHVISLRDISERRAVERLQQEFIVMVTHDLKTPLTSIKGLAQLMRRRGAYSEPQVDAIVAQSNHLERLINDLLDVARLEAGRLELQRRPVDLVELARASAVQAQATSRAHHIAVEAPQQTITISGDIDRLRQVLQNLLANAIKYSPDGGDVVLRVAAQDGEAVISVTDRGLGIPAESLPRLFSRFHRAEATLNAGEGLGLGLYIARSLVEAHGGRIWAESEPGAGSTFLIVLPREA